MKYFIDIVETDTGKIVKTLKASSERQQEKIERGVLINLNHNNFHTTLREEETEAEDFKSQNNHTEV